MQQNVIVPTRTILHPRLDIFRIIYVQDISKNVCKKVQEKNIQRNPIFMTDADYGYILDGI